jgi:hypothetical protein
MKSSLKDARQDKAQAVFASHFEGFKASVLPEGFADLVPQTVNVEVHASNLPLTKIISTMANSLLTPGDQATIQNAAQSLPKLLQDNGAFVSIENTYTKSPSFNSDLSGKIDATPNTALGVTGKLKLTLAHLDETVQKLRDLATKPGADLKIMGYANSLAVLQMMGQEGRTPDGAPARIYNLEIMADGRTLLNGVDVQSLTGVHQQTQAAPVVIPAAPAPAPAPTTPAPASSAPSPVTTPTAPTPSPAPTTTAPATTAPVPAPAAPAAHLP